MSSNAVSTARGEFIVEYDFILEYDPHTGQWSATHRDYVDPPLAIQNKRGKPLLLRAREAFDRYVATAAARRTFPNHVGNYPGKRTPKPAGKPLSPRERFVRLAAHYLSHRMTYRNLPRGWRRRLLDELFAAHRSAPGRADAK